MEDILGNINADVDVVITTSAKTPREVVMEKLALYESIERDCKATELELEKLETEYNKIVEEINLANKELVDKIVELRTSMDNKELELNVIKDEILENQRQAFNIDENDKTLVYNKIQSTYVAPTEKNSFDLKTFRVEQQDFWNNNIETLMPYAKITPVADCIKITNKK